MIDLWNSSTFDSELLDVLNANRDLIASYFETEYENFTQYVTQTKYSSLRPNIHHSRFFALQEGPITNLLKDRRIRAWHYTRLCDHEIDNIRRKGIKPSTLDLLRHRLDQMVMHGYFSNQTGDILFDSSPLHSEAFGLRSGMFWITSRPIRVDESDVEYLLRYWGGEVAYWQHIDKESDLRSLLSNTGQSRVLEMCISLSDNAGLLNAAQSVLTTFGKILGAHARHFHINLNVKRELPPDSIIWIHTENEPEFMSLARGYPVSFNEDLE